MTAISPDLEHEHLRYPAGRFTAPASSTAADRARWIDEVAALPAALRDAVASMTEAQLDTPYRPDGWTARQVIHHLPDSHMNAFIRFKLALSEDTPTIKPYDETRWALLADVPHTPVATSLALLEALHERWVILMRYMTDADWSRTYLHPEGNRTWRLDTALAQYAWHSRHHLGHVRLVSGG